MIHITITGRKTGFSTFLYERVRKKGRRTLVSTYHAHAICSDSARRVHFAVTRDTSAQVFGAIRHGSYERHGECPPNGAQRYHAFAGERGPEGFFFICLFEQYFPERECIRGRGRQKRASILIHVGEASSRGCFTVAGLRREYESCFCSAYA